MGAPSASSSPRVRKQRVTAAVAGFCLTPWGGDSSHSTSNEQQQRTAQLVVLHVSPDGTIRQRLGGTSRRAGGCPTRDLVETKDFHCSGLVLKFYEIWTSNVCTVFLSLLFSFFFSNVFPSSILSFVHTCFLPSFFIFSFFFPCFAAHSIARHNRSTTEVWRRGSDLIPGNCWSLNVHNMCVREQNLGTMQSTLTMPTYLSSYT
ncbi:hypothetical protein VTG60DRAFT_6327 [Thermothelomyces hinnuleus]